MNGNTWKLQDAKNRLSEVVETALRQGPQIVKRRGQDTVVILSIKDYRRLTRPKTGLVAFFKKSPLHGVRLDLTRGRELSREVRF